jgi:hypothetical protein
VTDEELIGYFERAEEPPGGFHHVDHVRTAWCYAREEPWPESLHRFRAGLRRYAAARCKPERYHETITVAFMALVHERLDEPGARALTWEAFAARHADLLAWSPSILDRYYRPETLASERARRTFVLPDRAALPGGASLTWTNLSA